MERSMIMNLKEKLARRIVHMAEKAAYKSVGKSIPYGMYEIKPPEELVKRKRENRNGSVMQRDS